MNVYTVRVNESEFTSLKAFKEIFHKTEMTLRNLRIFLCRFIHVDLKSDFTLFLLNLTVCDFNSAGCFHHNLFPITSILELLSWTYIIASHVLYNFRISTPGALKKSSKLSVTSR